MYSRERYSSMARRRKRSRTPFGIIAVAAVVLAAVIWLVFFPPMYDVNVNGKTVSVRAGSTLQQIVDDGHADPAPGDLLAVDGSVLESGKGDAMSATVNGSPTNDPGARVSRDAVIVIEDGADATEPYTERTETVPFKASETPATPSSYYTGAIHLYSQGVDGEQSVRKGEVSGKTVTVTTKAPVDSGFSSYSADVGGDKVVALTFDDGPWPQSSSQILDILKANDAHATFFVIGEQCKDNATVLKEIDSAGNQIATHTYDHANGSGNGVDLTKMSPAEQVAEVTKGFDAIEEVLGHAVSRVMRAPGGNYHGALVETLSPYVDVEFGWDVDTQDWSRPGVDAIVQRILSVQPGQVILMHDGGGDRSQSVEALRQALPQLKAQGYRFVTVDELLGYGNSGG